MISDKLIQEISDFKDLLIEISTQFIELRNDNETLKEKNTELFESLMNNDSSLSEVKDVESDLRHKLKGTEYRVEQLEAENKALSSEIEEKDILLDELREKESSFSAENINLNNNIQSLQKSVHQKDILLGDLNSSIAHIKKELNEKKDLLFDRDKVKSDLVENNALLKNEIYHLKIKLEKYYELKTKAKEYDELVAKNSSDEAQLINNIEELKQLTYSLEEEHAKEKAILDSIIATKEETIKVLEDKLREVTLKHKESEDYDLELEIEKLRSELEQRTQEVKELNEAGYGVLGQTLFGTLDFNDTKLQINNTKSENAPVAEKTSTSEISSNISNEEIEKKQFRIELLEDENQELKTNIEAQTANIENLEALVKKRYKQIQVLEQELNESISYQLATKDKRLKLADSLEKYLQKIEKIIEN